MHAKFSNPANSYTVQLWRMRASRLFYYVYNCEEFTSLSVAFLKYHMRIFSRRNSNAKTVLYNFLLNLLIFYPQIINEGNL